MVNIHSVAFLFYGFLCLVSQLLLFRELAIVFYGNELFLGFALAAWFFWIGAGSLLIRHYPGTEKAPVSSFALGLGIMFFLLPLTVLAIRFLKTLFPFGELIGVLPMTLLTFLALSVYCLFLGALFPLGCSVAAEEKKSLALGKVYFWESIGSILGGIIFTYLLIGHLPVLSLALMLSAGCLCFSFLLCLPGKRLAVRLGWVIPVFLVFFLVILKWSPGLDRWSREKQWHGYHLVAQTESRYSHLALARVGSIKSFFENGLISAHFPDPVLYEELAHWPLLLHHQPRYVLVMGQAATGLLAEIMKHQIERIDYLELDPGIIRLISGHLDPNNAAALIDPRVRIHHIDGRVWLKSAPQSYDAVILNLPEPANASINRLYTQEFYHQVYNVLAPHGILAFTVPSAENYISPEVQFFNSSIYRTLAQIFRHVEIIPGDNLLFLASLSPLELDERILTRHYYDRRISNQYVIPVYFPHKLSLERRAYVRNKMEEASGSRLNTDFAPVSYYYHGKLWLIKFASPLYFLSGMIFLGLIGWLLRTVWRNRSGLIKNKSGLMLFLLGFGGTLIEVILILAFQSLHGYVYWRLGILFAAFMIGLALGSGIGRRAGAFFSYPTQSGILVGLIGGMAVLALVLPLFLRSVSTTSFMIFPFILILTGFILGFAFPLAGGLSLATGRTVKQASSGLYAADLWGASLGAGLAGCFLIPFLGLWGSLIFTAGVEMVGMIILVFTPGEV